MRQLGAGHQNQFRGIARTILGLASLLALGGCLSVSHRAIQNGMAMSIQNGGRFGAPLDGSRSIRERTSLFYNSTPLAYQRTTVSPFEQVPVPWPW
jgi:hypothetical protein